MKRLSNLSESAKLTLLENIGAKESYLTTEFNCGLNKEGKEFSSQDEFVALLLDTFFDDDEWQKELVRDMMDDIKISDEFPDIISDYEELINFIGKPIEKVIDKLADFSHVYQVGYSEEHNCLHFMISPPYDTDEWFEIYIDNDKIKTYENIVECIEEFRENYDIDYETYKWLGNDGHGKNGAPYHIEDILKHYKRIDDTLYDIIEHLKK